MEGVTGKSERWGQILDLYTTKKLPCANKYSLKTAANGKSVKDKAKGSAKEIKGFGYSYTAVEEFKAVLADTE